jgi:hypothetical protein
VLVGLEIGELFVDVGSLGVHEVEAGESCAEVGDVAVVEIAETHVYPRLSSVDPGDGDVDVQAVEVFTGVEQVDDLDGLWEVAAGQVPDLCDKPNQPFEPATIIRLPTAKAWEGALPDGRERRPKVVERPQGGSLSSLPTTNSAPLLVPASRLGNPEGPIMHRQLKGLTVDEMIGENGDRPVAYNLVNHRGRSERFLNPPCDQGIRVTHDHLRRRMQHEKQAQHLIA